MPAKLSIERCNLHCERAFASKILQEDEDDNGMDTRMVCLQGSDRLVPQRMMWPLGFKVVWQSFTVD